MKQKEAKFIQMGAGGLGGLFAKTVYVFEVDGRQIKYNFNRFLSGMQPDMNTLGTLTVTDDEELQVMLTKKMVDGVTVDQLRAKPFMYGIMIKNIKRGGVNIPVLAQTELQAGDVLTINGLAREVNAAAPQLGYVDRPTNQTDLIFVGLGIVIGGFIGALTLHMGGVPISLSTSGGALIAGLVFGWLRSKRPTFGRIPEPSLWILNNLGLNMFIAVIWLFLMFW